MQTTDGYLWIATLNGVARFDGIRFVVFDRSNTDGIGANRFISMIQDSSGALWLVSEGGSIVRYQNGKFHTLGLAEGVRPLSVAGVTADSHGGVWIVSDGAIKRWVDTAKHFQQQSMSPTQVWFTTLWWTGSGFWGVKEGKLFCFVHGQLSVHDIPKSLSDVKFKDVAIEEDGTLWISLPGDRLATISSRNVIISSTPVERSFTDKSGRRWQMRIATNLDRTLLFSVGGKTEEISYNIINEDNESNLWVGAEGQGLFRIQKQSIMVYSKAQGLVGRNIYPVFKSRDGSIWAGTWPAGLSQIRDGRVVTYTQGDGVPGPVTALAEDGKGQLWVGTHGGLRVLTQGHLHLPVELPISDLPTVQAILQTRDGSMMLATQHGVYVLDGSSSHWLTSKDGLVTDDARVLIQSRNNDIWIGGYGGLTRIHNGTMQRWTEQDGLPSDTVRAIYEDEAGDLWIGTYDGGLGRLRSGRWTTFNTKAGLFDNGVFQVLEDSHANLWMSSNRGISRVPKEQLNDVAAGRRTRVEAISYGKSDGMLSVECNGGLWPAGTKDDRGRLWFPTQDGVVVLYPDSLSIVHQPPKVVIENASIDHVSMGPVRSMTMKPGQTNVEIQYTALSFSKPDQISFRYKLEGMDKVWEDAGHRRAAYYSHIPPGKYTFHVAATNSDGVTSVADSTLHIAVVPAIYQRWWFQGSIFAIVIALISASWSYRARRSRLEQAAQQAFSRQLIASQENERRRVAAELHDSLGPRLIIIRNLALFFLRPKRKASGEGEILQALEEISSEASFAIEETRTISYNLRPFHLDRVGLSRAIQGLVKTASRASNIEFTVEMAEIDDVFPPDLRINFLRIVQEGVNNILKHSQATRASIRVYRNAGAITLLIEDNGRGVPPETRSFSSGVEGFGLTGLKERAALLKGSFQMRSDSDSGTLLTFEFPFTETERP